MTTPPIVDEAEAVLRETLVRLGRIFPGECLFCYLWRQLEFFPCDGTLRMVLGYRDRRASTATALATRLGRVGAHCDCEVFWNGYEPHARLWTPQREVEEDGVVYVIDPEPIDPLPPCSRVKRGSSQPCANWQRIRRRW